MRCETEIWPFNTDVVMSPSVRPINLRGGYAHLLGRSPDLRVVGLKIAFPVSGLPVISGFTHLKPRRLQLRGQSRFWPLLGRPHRIPC